MKTEVTTKSIKSKLFTLVSIGLPLTVIVGIFAPLGFIRVYSWIMASGLITYSIWNFKDK